MAEASTLVEAIEDVWAAIRDRHEDVPEVIVTLGSGSTGSRGRLTLGHFAAQRWVRGQDQVHELFVGGEGLAHGAVAVLGTLLHEAAHGAAVARGVQDTSRQGRYHNKKFQALAEELGIDVEHDQSNGWSATTVPQATQDVYAEQVARLDAAITAHRQTEVTVTSGGRTSNNNGKALVCGCGRKVRASVSVAEAGPITCGLCGTDFTVEDTDDEKGE